jgi:hypothetical protein
MAANSTLQFADVSRHNGQHTCDNASCKDPPWCGEDSVELGIHRCLLCTAKHSIRGTHESRSVGCARVIASSTSQSSQRIRRSVEMVERSLTEVRDIMGAGLDVQCNRHSELNRGDPPKLLPAIATCGASSREMSARRLAAAGLRIRITTVLTRPVSLKNSHL